MFTSDGKPRGTVFTVFVLRVTVLVLVSVLTVTASVLVLPLLSWSCASRPRQFKTPDDWQDASLITHCQCNYQKVAISDQYLAIARKQLKIDEYMLLCVWPALNPLSIHVKFTMIVPGAYPGEAKMCKNVLKCRTFELTDWITGKRLKRDGYMLQCVWQALNPLFHPCDTYRDCHRVVPRGGQNVHIAYNISLLIYYSWNYLYSWRINK